ncbi:MAG: SGNH/GDSL hydrolase family protein [Nanoarchaeota archaeon]
MEEISTTNNEINLENPIPKKFFNRKDLKKNLLILGITILVVMIFFEIGLRLFYPQKLYDDCYEYSYKNLSNLEVELDSHFGWKLIPNYTGCRYQPDTNKIISKIHNSNGLRMSKEISYEKGNKKRVLLLGDSFVYGFGLNDSETIAVKLQEDLGENYEVINMGVDGYGTGQEILQFYEEGLKYDPDIVLLFFYPNDFSDTSSWDKAFSDKPIFQSIKRINLGSGKTFQTSPDEILAQAKTFLESQSKIILLQQIVEPSNLNFVLNNETVIIENYPTKMTWNNKYGPSKNPLSKEHPTSSIFLRFSHLYSLIFHKLSAIENAMKVKYSQRISDAIDIFIEKEYSNNAQNLIFAVFKLFDEFKELSEKNDLKFIVIGIPEKRGVSEEYQKKFLNLYSDVDESYFDFRKIDEIFNDELPKRNINYISLYDLADENFDKFYFKTDPHWNPDGVKMSADYITEELKRKGIVQVYE